MEYQQSSNSRYTDPLSFLRTSWLRFDRLCSAIKRYTNINFLHPTIFCINLQFSCVGETMWRNLTCVERVLFVHFILHPPLFASTKPGTFSRRITEKKCIKMIQNYIQCFARIQFFSAKRIQPNYALSNKLFGRPLRR